MSDADESDHENDNHEPVPQQQITMLFSKDDFMDKVARDTEHLCCVIVTSTICVYSGLRDLTYPTTMDGVLKQRQELGMNDGFSDDDVHQDTDDNGNPDVNNAAEVSSNDAVNAALRRMPKLNSLSNSRFFDEVCKRLVTNRATVHQRRHVRVFNICACCEDEVNIRPLAVAMYGASGSQAAKHTSVKAVPAGGVGDYGTRDVAELNKLRAKAYANLVELLHMLNVRSTPAMLFLYKASRYAIVRCWKSCPVRSSGSLRAKMIIWWPRDVTM